MRTRDLSAFLCTQVGIVHSMLSLDASKRPTLEDLATRIDKLLRETDGHAARSESLSEEKSDFAEIRVKN